eukprot:5283610-Heterocapsa_arctica.AAC.1
MGKTDKCARELYRTDGVQCINTHEDGNIPHRLQKWSWNVDNMQGCEVLQMQHHRQSGEEAGHHRGQRRDNHLLRENKDKGLDLERHH